ncbi:MAG: TraB family protein [Candidatus Altiarchaeales archaeon]|nr:MAG: TraB family protein [Candidatus Altiarchaeales archaeon]
MVIRIIGTGHILSRSVEEVRTAISEEMPDVVAVELDLKRFRALEDVGFNPKSYQRRVSFKDLIVSLVGGGSFPVFLEGVLALIQKELGEKYGIYPGSDMCAAIVSAKNSGSRIALIDRDIEITMNRLMRVPLREIVHLLLSRGDNLELVSRLLNSNIEGILGKENLDIIMDRLKKEIPNTYKVLVDERDRYMAHTLHRIQKENPSAKILAVVGAGHKRGISEYLERIGEGYGTDIQKILEIRPVSSVRILFLVFMVFVTFILIKSGFLLMRKK